MPRDATKTRESILDAAETLVLEKGFGGTSIDQVIERAGITKGALFYHFGSKADLARALIDRYVERDDALLHELLQRAEALSRDPLQQYLIVVGLLEEALRASGSPHPGCLVGSYVYQFEVFDAATRATVASSFDAWRRALSAKLDAARERHTPRLDVGSAAIVDNLLSLFEGGIILARLDGCGDLLADQIRHHRNYVELLFDVAD